MFFFKLVSVCQLQRCYCHVACRSRLPYCRYVIYGCLSSDYWWIPCCAYQFISNYLSILQSIHLPVSQLLTCPPSPVPRISSHFQSTCGLHRRASL